MTKNPIAAALCTFALALVVTSSHAEQPYRTVSLGKTCSVSIPTAWKEEPVHWNMPGVIQKSAVHHELTRYKHGGLTFEVSCFKSKRSARTGSAESQAVTRLSSAPDVTDFSYECKPHKVTGAASRRCEMRYKERGQPVHLSTLYIFPDKDPNVECSLAAAYPGSSSRKEIDRVFASVKLAK
ncbi:MAG: hypothetical protein JSW10_05455 [Pseudomonadota bacterium]|nr:MAG: hypothetical protein JSW10_05455 [Pseudomonadota bacterium]